MNMQTNAQVEVSEMQRESIYPWTPRPVVTAGGYLLSKIDAIVSNFDRQLSDNRNWENSPRTVDVVQLDNVRERLDAIRRDSTQQSSVDDRVEISEDSKCQAFQVAETLVQDSFPSPRIERGTEDSFLFMWRTARYVIDLEIYPDGETELYIYDKLDIEPYVASNFNTEIARLRTILSVRSGSN